MKIVYNIINYFHSREIIECKDLRSPYKFSKFYETKSFINLPEQKCKEAKINLK